MQQIQKIIECFHVKWKQENRNVSIKKEAEFCKIKSDGKYTIEKSELADLHIFNYIE